MADPMADIKSLADAALKWPARLLFPPVCAGCRRQVSQPGVLCASCWPQLRLLERPWCPVMGTPFVHDMGEGFLSAEAIADPPPFERARAAVAYSGVARQMVQGLKYRDRTDLAPWMARWMARAGAELMAEADVVVAVPLHWRRFLKRRFNQSAELARALAGQSRLPFSPSALKRVKVTRQQVGLERRQREDNVRAAFRVPAEAEIGIAGRRVLLIDDVYTTGATVRAAAKALKKGGAGAVDVLTFARVLPGDSADIPAEDFRPVGDFRPPASTTI
ncbi:MAG: ComF family protein [Mesorhizobium sp.]